MNIEKILTERGKEYGRYSKHAEITQALKDVMSPYKHKLSAPQIETLEMIFHKIGRILNGNPNYKDSWVDIVGYTQLIIEILEKAE